MILGIDTSAAQCAVALLGAPINAGDPVVERRAMERGHAEPLFPMIDSVLGRAGIGYDGLSRIAVCTGPGSFTGVRIGVAAARGIALGRRIPDWATVNHRSRTLAPCQSSPIALPPTRPAPQRPVYSSVPRRSGRLLRWLGIPR